MKAKKNSTMKSIKQTNSNKNRVFDLNFFSKQTNKLDTVANTLPKTFKQSERGSGYSFFSDEREYSFSVRGYRRANALIAYFVTRMPRVRYAIFTANQDFNHKN